MEALGFGKTLQGQACDSAGFNGSLFEPAWGWKGPAGMLGDLGALSVASKRF